MPVFGDVCHATIATLGINPSNLEFVDDSGRELSGPQRRFPTLVSLGLEKWADVEYSHINTIIESCGSYFRGNPYNRWFGRLESILAGINASFYDSLFVKSAGARVACHLDLIPYATKKKWTDLTPQQRESLLKLSSQALPVVLRDSSITTLILNGRSVVESFSAFSGVAFETVEIHDAYLPRRNSTAVRGLGFQAKVDRISGVSLEKSLLVLGYNHNLQSSFGVTAEAIAAVRNWLTDSVAKGPP